MSPGFFAAIALMCLAGCVDDSENVAVAVAWVFADGDCASNGIETVRVEVTRSSGAPLTGEAACQEGRVELGTAEGGGSIVAQGLDAGGVVRAQNYGMSVSNLQASSRFGDIEVTLHPKPSNVIVTWNGCPGSVILPYFITLYNPPAQTGDPLTDDVKSVQASCSTREATLETINPGDYVVELDSRAVTPKVLGTRPVTVVAGEDVTVHIDLP